MCGTSEAASSEYDRLRAILLGDNPFLPPPWPVWDLPDNPLGPRVRLWDEAFAPKWDNQPPTVTPELSSEEWAALHVRTVDYGMSPFRMATISAMVRDLIGTA